MSRATLDILIPTFNRAAHLMSNLESLRLEIERLDDPSLVSVLVSDNASTDSSWELLEGFQAAHPEMNLKLTRQDQNRGLEQNVVDVFGLAVGDWVMFLGDDDRLPTGYLRRVLEVADSRRGDCVLPGVVALDSGNERSVLRGEVDGVDRWYGRSLRSVATLSGFGHQLSGVAVRRAGTLEAYLSDPANRNLYPFIFFVGYNVKRGGGWYLGKFQTEVLEGGEKDWSYDSSYLLRDALVNYASLFPNSAWRRAYCDLSFFRFQPWRLGVYSRKPSVTVAAFSEIVRSRNVSWQARVLLPLVYAVGLARRAWKATAGLIRS